MSGLYPVTEVMRPGASRPSMEGGYPLEAEKDSDSADLRATARRFLEFQRGFLRQRWASYYALWASAVTSYFVLPLLLGFTLFSALSFGTRFLIFAGLDLVLTIAALTVTLLVWGHAERTSRVRSATNGRPSLTGRRNLLRFAIAAAIVVGVLAVSTRSAFVAPLLVDTILLVLSLLLLLHLHRAFRPIPLEGWLAAAAFLAAAAVSYGSLLLFASALGHEIAWSVAIVVWFGCAAYARFGVHEDPGGS